MELHSEKDYHEHITKGAGSSEALSTVDTEAASGTGSIKEHTTKRALKSRHVQLIALGGCIGTGLFVGSGAMLSNSGPASILLAYIIMSFLIYVIMNALGEMATYLPIAGASPPMYVNRFVDESLAFACGWNYWYAYAVLVASEVTAAAIVVQYWTEKVPVAVWITIFLVVIVCLNGIAVSIFGECEFWFASIKLIGIVGLIIVGIVIFFGGAPKHDRLGFRYWKHNAFKEYIVKGDGGRFCGVWNALIRSGFSYILSPELVTISAGETEAPRRNIPKATRRFSYRLVFFYVLGSLVIGCIVSGDDPRLLGAINAGGADASASPYVIGIQNAGIPVLNHIINAVILTSAWSAGNSFLYAGSRTLYSLARQGEAPAIFKKCTPHGVPYLCVAATALVGCLAYLNVSTDSAQAFTWFTNISTVSGFLSWMCVLSAMIRFRKAIWYNHQTYDVLPFKTPFQPWSTYFVLVMMTIMCLTNGFNVFVGGSFNGPDFVAAYITVPLFVVIYLGHRFIYKRATFKTPVMRPIHEIDITTGLKEAEEVEAMYPERKARNWVEKVWFWLA